jgi:hypothetical protein
MVIQSLVHCSQNCFCDFLSAIQVMIPIRQHL